MIASRIIYDPGPPTLPRRWVDRAFGVALAVGLLIALMVVALGALASLPAPTPTAPSYVQCTYCKFTFPAKRMTPGHYVFLDHEFIRIPVTGKTDFETCITSYFLHIEEMVEVMRKVGAGKIVPAERPTREVA